MALSLRKKWSCQKCSTKRTSIKRSTFRHSPELRENLGEIEAAEKGTIPRLIEPGTSAEPFTTTRAHRDGRSNMKEMIAAAEKLGWDYLGISDHSKIVRSGPTALALSVFSSRSKRSARSMPRKSTRSAYLPAWNATSSPTALSISQENSLEKLDYAIVSVHSSLTQDEKTMTKRIIKALEHPLTTMLGHPTGRLLLKRDPIK